jgi:imidazole glycerol-phosphate synthase subunit HisF
MKTRIIAKLDVKPPNVVKPVHFEGLRKIGEPEELAIKYYNAGVDEIMYIDIVSSLYRREILYKEIKQTAKKVFIPFGVGGGVQTIEDFSKLFHAGADKVIINTFAVQNNPEIINQAAEVFGNQAVVVSIEAKKWSNWYECYTDCGRIRSGKNVLDWVKEVEERGAGEILLQSVDNDGRQNGFDLELAGKVVNAVQVPVVVGSGAGKVEDILELISTVNPSGVALASVLHYDKIILSELRKKIDSLKVEA